MQARRKWDDTEVRFICNGYGKLSVTEMARHLGRPYKCVDDKLRKIGIKPPGDGNRLNTQKMLCDTCARPGSLNTCAWFGLHKPVRGWEVVQSDGLHTDADMDVNATFRVKKCPLYAYDGRSEIGGEMAREICVHKNAERENGCEAIDDSNYALCGKSCAFFMTKEQQTESIRRAETLCRRRGVSRERGTQ